MRAPEDAARIARTLAPMIALRVSCSAPEIELEGDRATVRFVRVDRWSDLTAARFEHVHPVVSRHLRRHEGQWIVADDAET